MPKGISKVILDRFAAQPPRPLSGAKSQRSGLATPLCRSLFFQARRRAAPRAQEPKGPKGAFGALWGDGPMGPFGVIPKPFRMEGHFESLGPKGSKIVSKLTICTIQAALGPKGYKMTPKLIIWNIWPALGPKWHQNYPFAPLNNTRQEVGAFKASLTNTLRGLGAFQASSTNPSEGCESFNQPFRGLWAFKASSTNPSEGPPWPPHGHPRLHPPGHPPWPAPWPPHADFRRLL